VDTSTSCVVSVNHHHRYCHGDCSSARRTHPRPSAQRRITAVQSAHILRLVTHSTARTVEVCVLDGDDARLGEDLLGEVVDQLPVDEARDACVHERGRRLGMKESRVSDGVATIRHRKDKYREPPSPPITDLSTTQHRKPHLAQVSLRSHAIVQPHPHATHRHKESAHKDSNCALALTVVDDLLALVAHLVLLGLLDLRHLHHAVHAHLRQRDRVCGVRECTV
jgi:hypothetical protein